MKRMMLGFSLLALAALPQRVLAHGYPEETLPAAHQFATAVEHFHHVIEHVTGFSHLAADVHKLADSARHFQRAVQGGASYEHARRDFAKIHQAYHHALEAVKHAHGAHHNPHVMRDWTEVEYAFEDLDWSLGG